MLKIYFITLVFIKVIFTVHAQNITSPEEFLGYRTGDRFTYHHQVVDYFRHVSENSEKVQFVNYGKSFEGRPLIGAIVTASANLKRIDQLRENNLINAGLKEGKAIGEQLPIIWLSYGIHGNEASGTEVALKALYYLATNNNKEVNDWLDNLIIIIDPCLNPDGREKYAVWYHQASGKNIIPERESWEHHEPWPGSRVNHYLFDLNRDWVWQTQTETLQRIAFYQKWMPHVHIDFHEMGYENPYFFAPGSKPYNEAITDWQKEFQKILGANLSEVFDERGELYFTNEVFDLFSPIFGDTWPTFNGALGFTFEQGGGGSAGLAVIKANGDTITFKNRIDNHYSSTIATITSVFNYRKKIVEEFNKFFRQDIERFPSDYKTYILKAEGNADHLQELFKLLDKNQILYYYPAQANKKISGYDYFSKKSVIHQLKQNDIIVPTKQPHSHLVKVLFEPETKFHDTISYDLTSWSLPYVYGLPAIASRETIGTKEGSKPAFKAKVNISSETLPYAYIIEWKSFYSAKFLSSLLNKKIKVRYAHSAFEMGNRKFPKGSLVINRIENQYVNKNFDSLIVTLANKNNVELFTSTTGKSATGKDLGSSDFRFIKPIKIALIKGRGVSSNSVGEMWFYFDQEINYPLSMIELEQIGNMDLSKFDLIIMPSGNYSQPVIDKVLAFAKNGGRIIALERALQAFEKDKNLVFGKTLTEFREKQEKEKLTEKKAPDSLLIKYEERRKRAVQNISSSSFYKLALDNSHPVAYGIGSEMFIIKRNSLLYPYLPETAYNIGYYSAGAHLSGYVGSKLKKDLENTLGIGQEAIGRGSIIYITDTPIYRSFFYGGKLLLSNMIFFETSLNLPQNYTE